MKSAARALISCAALALPAAAFAHAFGERYDLPAPLSYFMAGGAGTKPVPWQFQISLFLAPVVLYGLMMLGQRFPRSEASSSGVSFKDMLGELGLVGAAVICGLLALFFKSDLGLSPLVAGGIAAGLLVAFGAATGSSE
jgi:hypothetical protein